MDPLSTHFHNPGAIIPGDKITYEGMLGTDPKSGLAIFDTPENGRKALDKDLAIKFRRGVNTPEKFARAYLGPKADQQEVDNYATAVADSYGFDATDTEFSEDTLPHLANTITAVEAGTKRPTLEDAKLPQAEKQDQSTPDVNSGWGSEPPAVSHEEEKLERLQEELLGAKFGAGFGIAKYPTFVAARWLSNKIGTPVTEAEARALMEKTFTAPVESQSPASSGDKWSKKVVGDMGPGGEGVTEAARNYRTQQSFTPREAANFAVDRSGIILPNELKPLVPEVPPAPVLPPSPEPKRTAIPKAIARGTSIGLQAAPSRFIGSGAGGVAALGDWQAAANRKDILGQGIAAGQLAASAGAALPYKTPNLAVTSPRTAKFITGVPRVSGSAFSLLDALRSLREGDYKRAAVVGGAGALPIAASYLATGLEAPAAALSMAVPLVYDIYHGQQQPERDPVSGLDR
jgi:hypothetical protein